MHVSAFQCIKKFKVPVKERKHYYFIRHIFLAFFVKFFVINKINTIFVANNNPKTHCNYGTNVGNRHQSRFYGFSKRVKKG